MTLGRGTRIRAVALVLGLLIVAAACRGDSGGGSEGEGPLRFTVWSSEEAHLEMLQGFAEDFAREHEGVKVEFTPIPIDDYMTKIKARLSGGDPPDAGWLGEGDAAALAEVGMLADLTPVLEAGGYDPDDFVASTMQNWSDGEATYGIPFSTSPLLLLYNKDLFRSAGVTTPDVLIERGEWTWESFAGLAEQLEAQLPARAYPFVGQDGSTYESISSLWNTTLPVVRAYGGEVWNLEQADCTLDEPQAVEAFTLLHDMIFRDRSMVPPGEQADFFAGQAAMTVNQLSRVALLQEAKFEWEMVPLPSGPAGDVHYYGQAGVVAFEESPNAELAKEFVAFMTNKENVQEMARFFPPARRSVLETEQFLKANPMVNPNDMELVRESIEEGSSLPAAGNNSEIGIEAQSEFDQLWVRDAPVAGVLEDVCRAVEPMLAQG